MIRQIMTLATLCWMMAGCADETFNREQGEGTGYLRLTLGKVEVALSATTKADASRGAYPGGGGLYDRYPARRPLRRGLPQAIRRTD